MPSLALGKEMALGKINLCRGLNMAGWVTAATGVSLCRVPAVRHSAKIFIFFKYSLPRAIGQSLGKDFLFFLNILCRGSLARPSAKTPFTEGQARPSAKSFFLVFLTQFFCGAIIHYLKLNFKIWANFDFF